MNKLPHAALQNKAKTHCKRGHEFDGVTAEGWRVCMTCQRARDRSRKRMKALDAQTVREVEVPISKTVVAPPIADPMERARANMAALLAKAPLKVPAKPVLPEPEYTELKRVPIDENGNPC